MSDLSRRNFLGTAMASVCAAGLPGAARASIVAAEEARLPYVAVHPEGHFLQTSGGSPFFWLADTAWQLMHRLTWEESCGYLSSRARQGFSVVQIVALCEFDGITEPNILGEKPFVSIETLEPNEAYFNHLVRVVEYAERLGLYVAVLPTWGDKLTAPWGEGPRIFRTDNLQASHRYAAYITQKLGHCNNVIWMLGGDRPARLEGDVPDIAREAGFSAGQNWLPVWNAFAEEIRRGSPHPPLILYHPNGGDRSTSVLMADVPWLSANGMQSGHNGGHDVPVWNLIARDYAVKPPKPTLDLEPNYEDHPVDPWPRWNPADGYFRAADVRRQTYRSVFAGGCGVTYGHHAIWQFAGAGAEPINHVDMDWRTAIERPGAAQMNFLRSLMLSRPYFSRVPAPEMVLSVEEERGRHVVATRDKDGSYAFIFVPQPGMNVQVDMSAVRGQRWKGWWYNPMTGLSIQAAVDPSSLKQTFRSPENGADVVLVLDAEDTAFPPPGLSGLHSDDKSAERT